MKSLDYTFCVLQDTCNVANCPRKMSQEQKDYWRDHQFIPVAFSNFDGTEECPKEKRIKGTLHLWSKRE